MRCQTFCRLSFASLALIGLCLSAQGELLESDVLATCTSAAVEVDTREEHDAYAALGGEGVEVVGDTDITGDVTWTADKTWLVTGIVLVKGGTLTIEPGAKVLLGVGSGIRQDGGTVVSEGVAFAPMSDEQVRAFALAAGIEVDTREEHVAYAALGGEGVEVVGDTDITGDVTWTADKTWLVTGIVLVKGGTLTIEPGAKVLLGVGSGIRQDGGMVVSEGVAFAPMSDEQVRVFALAAGIEVDTREEHVAYAALGGEGVEVVGDTDITGDVTWTADKAWLVTGIVLVKGGTLTIEPGAKVMLGVGSGIRMDGGVVVSEGVAFAPMSDEKVRALASGQTAIDTRTDITHYVAAGTEVELYGEPTWTAPNEAKLYTLSHTDEFGDWTAEYKVVGDNVIVVGDTGILDDATWTSDKTWIIAGTVLVQGGTLTIEPGTMVLLGVGSGIRQDGGTVVADGVAFSNIAFDGRMDYAEAEKGDVRMDTDVGHLRVAAKEEPIAFSSLWGESAAEQVKVSYTTAYGEDAEVVSEVGPTEGEYVWQAEMPGYYTFTHLAGGETLTAEFVVTDSEATEVVKDGEISESADWSKDKVILIDGILTVKAGSTLTIEPGTIVKFMDGAGIVCEVGGRCVADGVIFTHVNDDTVGGDTLLDGSTSPLTDMYVLNGVSGNDATQYRYHPDPTVTLSGTISKNEAWRGFNVYHVTGNITVQNGVTLTIEPGAIIKFDVGKSLTINSGATLNAIGTRAEPIIFTSIKDDDYGGDTNKDGDKTYAQAGDWARIYAGGTLNMAFCQIRHCNNNSDNGAIQGTGGTVTFNNGIIESSVYECVRMNSGSFTAYNSVFRDSSMGFGYYGGSGVYIYNCVVADCTIGCRASNKHFYNTVFYRCQTFLESTSSSCDHCVFFNPVGYGAQSATQVGSNGNIWGDPRFHDPDSTDFRLAFCIAEGSPCINVADVTYAPETDYFGQPRVDVPDIGICEFIPRGTTSDIDLVPQSVTADAEAVSGQPLTICWEIANKGGVDVDESWRDTVSLVSANGREVVLGEKVSTKRLVAGGTISCSAVFTVPAIAEGAWYPKVNLNSSRDIFEGALGDNNALTGETAVNVSVNTLDLSVANEGVINAGTPTVLKLNFDATNENRMVLLDVPAGVTVTWGYGFMPQGTTKSGAMTVTDDGVMFRVPDDATVVYVVLESDTTETYSLSTETTKMVITGVSPTTLPSSGTTTLTIFGAGFGETNEVVLISSNGRVVLSAPQKEDVSGNLIATVDCGDLTVGCTYDVKVTSGESEAMLPSEVMIDGETGFWEIVSSLHIPESMRQGRENIGFIEYENVGNIDAPLPIFVVKSKHNGMVSFSQISDNDQWRERLMLLGVGSCDGLNLAPGNVYKVYFKVKLVSSGDGSVLYGLLDESKAINMDSMTASFGMFNDFLDKANLLFGGGWGLFAEVIRAYVRRHHAYAEYSQNVRKLVSDVIMETSGTYQLSGHFRVNEILTTSAGTEVFLERCDESGANTVIGRYITDSTGGFVFNNISNGYYRITSREYSVNSNEMIKIDGMDAYKEINASKSMSVVVDISEASISDGCFLLCQGKGTDVSWRYHVEIGQRHKTIVVPNGDWMLSLLDENGRKILSPFELHQTGDVCSIRMEKLQTIVSRVYIEDESGNGIPDAQLLLCSENLCESYYTDVDGIAEVAHELMATNVIIVSALGFVDQVISVTNCNESLRICLMPGKLFSGVIDITGVNSLGSLLIEFSDGNNSYYTMADSQGHYSVYLPAGNYSIRGGKISSMVEHSRNKNSLLKSGEPSVGELLLLPGYETAFYSIVLNLMWAAYGAQGYPQPAMLFGKYIGVPGYNWGTPANEHFGSESALAKLAKYEDGFTTPYSAIKARLESEIKDQMQCNGTAIGRKMGRPYLDFGPMSKMTSPLYASFRGTQGLRYEINSINKTHNGEKTDTYLITYTVVANDMYEFDTPPGGQADQLSLMCQTLEKYGWAKRFKTFLYIKDNVVVTVDKKDEGESDQYDEKKYTQPHARDPNEMSGPLGLGNPETERFVKPGEELTYTIYFENVSNATAAAQEVYVTNPLSEWLDWSTFEMGEVAFGNQIDLGLSGKKGGTCEATMKGTNFVVRTELTLESTDGTSVVPVNGRDARSPSGVAKWYLRIVDPTTDTGWPKDILAGFLPPNDETFRGEGHLTYRIKVRDDAPAGIVITNKASIVFDYNDPIETDPAWWNTVGQVKDIQFDDGAGDSTTQNLIVGVPYGEALPTTPATGKPGYTFAGWYTGPNGTGRHITAESLVGDGDDGLYAYWAANTYFIGYNANGGEGEMAIQTNTYDVVSCLASNEFTNIGYVFAGWATQEDSEVVYRDGAVVSNLTTEADSVVDLYAIWGGWKIDFAATDIAVDEGSNIVLRISGGNADKASSVQVYLTYNTAAAADLDLKTATVADGDAAVSSKPPYQTNLKFPLTLSWAKSEIGEKVITIPVKTDKTVEDDEFFTLQLANAQGMELGEDRVCTVTIRDLNTKELKAAVTAYKPKKGQEVATNHVGVAVSADSALASGTVGGFVAGTGDYTSGSKLTLTAEARPGWSFAGWRLKDGDGTILSDKAKWQVVVTNDAEYVAVFEKIPYIRGLADPADGGKVSGSGLCAAGKKVTLKATANKNFTFLGWGTGNGEWGTGNGGEYVATTASLVIDRSAKPAANSKTSTTITNIAEDVTYYAVFKSYPEVFVTVEATDGTGADPTGKGAGKYVAGTITGMGKYAIGKKKIALKATANKGYVFFGWYDANGELLTKDATYTIASMGEDDVEYTAKFITADEDKANIKLAVDGVEMDAAVSSKPPYRTNVWAGVYLEWPVAAEALSATTVKVAGLPSGLKFTAKPVTSKVGSGKSAVVVTNVPANTIYGAPTAASKADKYGNVKPSAVKVTVTTAGKSSQAFAINLYIDPLPAWAVGTFDGEVGNGELGTGNGKSGTVALTVAAAGKISGKVLESGKTWALGAANFSRAEDSPESEVPSPSFFATVIGKAGKEIVTNEVAVTSAAVDNVEVGVASSDDWISYQNLWKRADTKAAQPVFKKNIVVEYYPLGEPGDANNTVKLTFKKDGVVSFAGKVGGASVSGTSQLVWGDNGWQVTLYAPPKGTAKPPFSSWCVTLAVTLDDANVVTDVEVRSY